MKHRVQMRPLIRKISRGNQVTLPPKFVAFHDLYAGDPIEMIEDGDNLILKVPAFSKEGEKKKEIENIKALFQKIDRIRDLEGQSHLSEEEVMENVIQEIKLQHLS